MRSPLCCAVVLWLLAGCDVQIQHGLDERSANELQSALVERGFEARKVLEPGRKPTWGIEVPEDRAANAVRVLSELGLPREKSDGFSELFGNGSLVPTPTEERALFLQATSGELARTLEAVDGVASARVHLVMPPPPRPGLPAAPAKAAAYLRVRPGRAADLQALRDDLRALIAGSVEGLEPAAVTLVLDEVRGASAAAPPPSASKRMRVMIAALGGLTALLAAAVAFLLVRSRRRAPAPAPPRPVVATAARRVA